MFQASYDPAPRQLKVLIADDNRDAADTLADLLNICGHSVVTAYDGQQALSQASVHPDVAILDLGMPCLSGWEVARQLRRLRPNMLLVAASGWGSAAHQAESADSGFDVHLTKPVDPMRVLGLLEAKAARAADEGADAAALVAAGH